MVDSCLILNQYGAIVSSVLKSMVSRIGVAGGHMVEIWQQCRVCIQRGVGGHDGLLETGRCYVVRYMSELLQLSLQ